MICWFEASVTDSFGPTLAGMRDGLGFLPGSACPHYDGEARRRPVYTRLVATASPLGSPATTPQPRSTRAQSWWRSSRARQTREPIGSDARARSRSSLGSI